MEFVVQSGGLPQGIYDVEFVGAELYTENAAEYGEGVSLKFKVTAGDHAGTEMSRIVAKKMTAKTKLGKFAAALKGGEIKSGERFNFDDYVGTAGKIVVETTDNGGTRISTFMRS
ncbi:MAG: hypothetical protein NXI32_26925 [bacterium]|nr:hypothetical protein [bacterium]